MTCARWMGMVPDGRAGTLGVIVRRNSDGEVEELKAFLSESGNAQRVKPVFVNHRRCSIMRVRHVNMSNVVHLLWFAKEMPEGEDDIELLIGVYSSNDEATAAIERIRDKPGLLSFRKGSRYAHIPLTAIIGRMALFWMESERCLGACEKAYEGNRKRTSGAEARSYPCDCGTTEVVPFPKPARSGVSPQPLK